MRRAGDSLSGKGLHFDRWLEFKIELFFISEAPHSTLLNTSIMYCDDHVCLSKFQQYTFSWIRGPPFCTQAFVDPWPSPVDHWGSTWTTLGTTALTDRCKGMSQLVCYFARIWVLTSALVNTTFWKFHVITLLLWTTLFSSKRLSYDGGLARSYRAMPWVSFDQSDQTRFPDKFARDLFSRESDGYLVNRVT